MWSSCISFPHLEQMTTSEDCLKTKNNESQSTRLLQQLVVRCSSCCWSCRQQSAAARRQDHREATYPEDSLSLTVQTTHCNAKKICPVRREAEKEKLNQREIAPAAVPTISTTLTHLFERKLKVFFSLA